MLFAKSRRGDRPARYRLAMALPILLFFLMTSFVTRVGLHWALPGYLSILTAVPVWVDENQKAGRRWLGSLYRLSIATSLAATLFFLSILVWPGLFVPWVSSLGIHHREINQGKALNSQSLTEIFGYPQLGERVSQDLGQLGGQLVDPFVFTDSYSLSSVISFYAWIDAKTLLFTSTGGDYDRWNRFENYRGRDALYVDTAPIGSRPDINQVLHQAFSRVVPLDSLTVQHGSINSGTFYFAHCVNLQNPSALRPSRPW